MDSGTPIGSHVGSVPYASGGCAARGERAARAAALAAFVRDQHQSLVRFLTQKVGSREAARDIVQRKGRSITWASGLPPLAGF